MDLKTAMEVLIDTAKMIENKELYVHSTNLLMFDRHTLEVLVKAIKVLEKELPVQALLDKEEKAFEDLICRAAKKIPSEKVLSNLRKREIILE